MQKTMTQGGALPCSKAGLRLPLVSCMFDIRSSGEAFQ